MYDLYYALTAELTDDYDERASLTAFRMVLGLLAYVVSAALTPAIVGLFLFPWKMVSDDPFHL